MCGMCIVLSKLGNKFSFIFGKFIWVLLDIIWKFVVKYIFKLLFKVSLLMVVIVGKGRFLIV